MNRVRFHDQALAELEAEALYYEARDRGLGERFTSEIEAATQIAAEFPEMGSPFKYGTRRVFPKKFPFSVVYRTHQSGIVVLAVAPDTRKPGYWRNRRNDGLTAGPPQGETTPSGGSAAHAVASVGARLIR